MVKHKASLYSAMKSAYLENVEYRVRYPEKDFLIDTINVNYINNKIELHIKFKQNKKKFVPEKDLKTFTEFVGVNGEFKILFYCLKRNTDLSKKEISNLLTNETVIYMKNPKLTCGIDIPIDRIDLDT